MKPHERKTGGFTLVEMLVVIAIIAVLVAVIIPTVSSATTKAKAAADAANLRSLLGEANTLLVDNNVSGVQALANSKSIDCKTFTGAQAVIAYQEPAFLETYFAVDDTNYYSLKYFQEIASDGKTDLTAVSKPTDMTLVYIGGEKTDNADN